MNNIVIKDGQAAPADHIFTPYQPQQGSTPAVWYERSGTSPLGWRRITLSVDTQVKGISKVRIVISDPVLANLSQGCCVDQNTPAVSYTDFANIQFNLPYSATDANRKDILAYAKNILTNASIVDAVVSLQPAV